MNVEPTVNRVWELAAQLVAEEGMEIVEIELRREEKHRGWVLRLYLDKEGGPNLDDLTRVSRQLSDLLDAHEVEIQGPYTLEVSSPGVNRVLRRPEHFARYVGKRIRIRTREAIEGRRSFLGRLQEVREGEIVIRQDGAEFHIPLSAIEKANYEHDWSA